jgi:hypothetical protein
LKETMAKKINRLTALDVTRKGLHHGGGLYHKIKPAPTDDEPIASITLDGYHEQASRRALVCT